MSIKHYLRLARVHQYTKNVFVFAPLFFGFLLFDTVALTKSLIAFSAFCLVASSIYVLNDLFDVQEDIAHPKKRNRPIAAGVVSKRAAAIFGFALFVLSVILCISCDIYLLLPILAYFILNVAYCLSFKRVAILDVFIIAVGFDLRVFTGGIAVGVVPSHWIIVLTFLLALFLALAKRRDDIIMYEKSGVKARKVVDGYSRQFLDIGMAISASICLMCYIMYSISPTVVEAFHTHSLYSTSVFVILGIFRYMQISFVLERSGSPSRIVLKDRFLQGTIVCWLIAFCVIIYT